MDGLTLFYHMQLTRIQLDQFTFINVFPTCAKFGPLEKGMSLHEEITRNGFQLGLLASDVTLPSVDGRSTRTFYFSLARRVQALPAPLGSLRHPQDTSR